jgi:hypothetical protein
MRAAVCIHPRGLVGQPLGWVNQLGFQPDFLTDVVTILDLDRLPGFHGHHRVSWGHKARSYGKVLVASPIVGAGYKAQNYTNILEYIALINRGTVSGVMFRIDKRRVFRVIFLI